jgi:hypothetical protein
MTEQESELNTLTNAIFNNNESISLDEFKLICEKNTSEIFLAVIIYPALHSIEE